MENKALRIGLVGNPNSGKTTLFNSLTGARQSIGNWPGVTVEKKEGTFNLPKSGRKVEVVDLPGIYSLTATSEDERAALEYVLSGEADLFVNIVDATNLERNLYLTMLLTELKVPIIIAVTMTDIATERKLEIDFKHLAQHMGCPVVPINGKDKHDIRRLVETLEQTAEDIPAQKFELSYPNEIEDEIAHLVPKAGAVAESLKTNARWVAIRLLESDELVVRAALRLGAITEKELEDATARIAHVLSQSPEESFADARYGVIQGLCHELITTRETREHFTQRVDKFILNRFLGIPFFLLVMYVVFWVTQTIGGAFIDFFDVLGSTVFVDGTAALLESCGAPAGVIALISSGLGAGLQTIATFVPPIFFMFFCLSLLEDSGYMARAAFVMDRFMRWLGLPGKSFVPLLVGFGCSVPAIMATRTLESRRDRFLTIFMTPFMSCGAKLPVYVVFGAAFFSDNPGKMVFLLYISGIVLAILTGLMLKHTLFRGEPSHFIMELPPYHMPRMRHILLHSWDRLKIFIFRAGKVIVPMVLLLGFFNSMGTDGSFGNEDSEESVLAFAGKKLTPIFEPMGVEKDNWPATVSIFTGLFAKEAVVGTMTSLYGQNFAMGGDAATDAETPDEALVVAESEAEAADDERFNFWGGISDAFATIPANLSEVFGGLLDPLGMGDVSGDEEAAAEAAETDKSVFEGLRRSFTGGRQQAFAYLLFILMYVPCLAAMGAAFRELGKFYGFVLMGYLTVLGWSVATLYYQLTLGHQTLWIVVALAFIAAMVAGFRLMGAKRKVDL